MLKSRAAQRQIWASDPCVPYGSHCGKPGHRPDSVAPPPGCPGAVPTLWRPSPLPGLPGRVTVVLTGGAPAEVEDVTAVHVMEYGSSRSGPAARTRSARHPTGGRQLPVSYTALRLPFIHTNIGFANQSDEKRLGGVVFYKKEVYEPQPAAGATLHEQECPSQTIS